MSYSPSYKTEAQSITAPQATSERIVVWIGFGFALLVGAYARLAPVLSSDFALNDGGLFYALTRDLIQNQFTIPPWTTYNGGQIPFAYPPLGFFVAGLLANLTGLPLLSVFHFVPAFVSLFTLVFAYLIAREIFGSAWYATLTMLVYALIPRSYQWLVMGGGIVRALAMVLVLASFYQTLLLLRTGRKRFIVTTGVVSGLALLAHPEVAVFWAGTFALLVWFYGRNKRTLWQCAVAAFVALTIALPWWILVWSRHGIAPILSSLQSGGNNGFVWIVAFLFGSSGEEFGTLWSILGLVGLAVALAKRQWFLPLWYLLPFVLVPRSAGTYMPLPLALLVTLTLGELIFPRLQELSRIVSKSEPVTALKRTPPVSRAVIVFAFLALILALFNVWSSNTRASSPLRALPREEREAMDWVAHNTPNDAAFVVLSPATEWSTDFTAEWFPALAGRASLATIQGQEWTAGGAFLERVDDYNRVQQCRTREAECLALWSTATGKSFTHVYLSKGAIGQAGVGDCCAALRFQLESSPQYEKVYDNAGASVFERR